jgi:hypothetical protein
MMNVYMSIENVLPTHLPNCLVDLLKLLMQSGILRCGCAKLHLSTRATGTNTQLSAIAGVDTSFQDC